MRVAVIGARQVRSGLGEHLASFCHAAGADVSAVFGTSAETARLAAAGLEGRLGVRPRPVWEPEALFEQSAPEALVIACPDAAHEAWLERALAHRCHVLCEKPLLWGGPDPAARAEGLGRAFLAAGLHLRVQAQWPHTLEVWRRLFPGVLDRPPDHFRMGLAPSAPGRGMFRSSLSHPLSLLAHVLPDPTAQIEEASAILAGEAGRIDFVYRTTAHAVRCTVEVEHTPSPPRHAAYGFDGHMATRIIRALEPYTLALEGGGRRIPLPDPTPLLVRSFLDDVASGPPQAIDPAVLPGMRHLARLMAAVPDAP